MFNDKKVNVKALINSDQVFTWLFLLLIAGIHSRDRTPPNSAAEIPCSNFPFPDQVYFDETSPYGEGWIMILKLLNMFEWILEYLQGCSIFKGSVIFVSNEITSTKLDWNVTSRNPRVAITLFDKRYNIILLTNVDLDVANVSCDFKKNLKYI